MRRTMACISFCLLALAATSTVLASPASAAVPGLQIVTAASPTNSISPKSIVATCPAGKRTIGTGAVITGGLGDVFVDDLRPSLTTVLATAYENGSSSRNWNIRAYAVCANPLPGLQIVSAVTPTNSNSPKSIVATCPAGTATTGAGAEITGGLGTVVIDDLRPTPTSVLATGYENGASGNNWNIRSYAICANPLPGLQIVSAASPTNSNSPKSITARCPAGKVVTGSGAEITGGLGDVEIDDQAPALASVLATGYENGASARSWNVRAYAICANQ